MTRRTRTITASVLAAAALGTGLALAAPAASAQPFYGLRPQACISSTDGGWQGEGHTLIFAPAIKSLPAAC